MSKKKRAQPSSETKPRTPVDGKPTRLELLQEMRRERGLSIPDEVADRSASPTGTKALDRAWRTPGLIRAAKRWPDWSVWRHVDEVALWEGVALSLNIEPRKVTHGPDGWMVDGRLSKEFSDHLLLARRFVPGHEDPDNARIALRQFAAWALSVGWEIPAALQALSATDNPLDDAGHTEGGQQPKPRISDGITTRLREKYFQLYDQHGKPPSQRALERETTYSRNAIRRRWDQVKAPRDADESS